MQMRWRWPQMRYLQLLAERAEQPARPKRLLVGLDFESFLMSADELRRPPAALDEQQVRLAALAAPGTIRQWQWLKGAVMATVTLDAFTASVSTVAASVSRQGNDLSEAGRTSEWQFRTWVAADGAYKSFEQKLGLSARQLGRVRLSLGDAGEPVRGLRDVRALLAWGQRNGAAVSLVIQPSHASHLLLLDGLGYWPAYEAWKRAVVLEVARAQALGAQAEVWDFGGFEAQFAEPVLPKSRAALQWFWDPVHYSSSLGDLIIASTQGRVDMPQLASQPLTPGSLTTRLAEVREQMARYRQANPALVEDIAKLLPKATTAQLRLP